MAFNLLSFWDSNQIMKVRIILCQGFIISSFLGKSSRRGWTASGGGECDGDRQRQGDEDIAARRVLETAPTRGLHHAGLPPGQVWLHGERPRVC